MKENRKSFLRDILWAFNISWIMIGSIIAGFLIGRAVSEILDINWAIIFFPIIGAIGGMWTVWKYYNKGNNG